MMVHHAAFVGGSSFGGIALFIITVTSTISEYCIHGVSWTPAHAHVTTRGLTTPALAESRSCMQGKATRQGAELD